MLALLYFVLLNFTSLCFALFYFTLLVSKSPGQPAKELSYVSVPDVQEHVLVLSDHFGQQL
jgi:hypothetical protein